MRAPAACSSASLMAKTWSISFSNTGSLCEEWTREPRRTCFKSEKAVHRSQVIDKKQGKRLIDVLCFREVVTHFILLAYYVKKVTTSWTYCLYNYSIKIYRQLDKQYFGKPQKNSFLVATKGWGGKGTATKKNNPLLKL